LSTRVAAAPKRLSGACARRATVVREDGDRSGEDAGVRSDEDGYRSDVGCGSHASDDDGADDTYSYDDDADGDIKESIRASIAFLGGDVDGEVGEVGGRSGVRGEDTKHLSKQDADLVHNVGADLGEGEEELLRGRLNKYLRELDRFSSSSQMKSLTANEKKKMRNRKASRVSRLRKKLSVYELARRYVLMATVKQEQEQELQEYRAALHTASNPASVVLALTRIHTTTVLALSVWQLPSTIC
jgi:hypothetical protein